MASRMPTESPCLHLPQARTDSWHNSFYMLFLVLQSDLLITWVEVTSKPPKGHLGTFKSIVNSLLQIHFKVVVIGICVKAAVLSRQFSCVGTRRNQILVVESLKNLGCSKL